MKLVLLASAIVLALLLSPSPALAQRGGGGSMHAGDSFKDKRPPAWHGNAQVSGRITDEAGHPIAEAKIAFILVSSNDGFFATTRKNGEFSARDIKGGEWRVQIEAQNFITARQTVTITDSKNPPLEIRLKRDNSPELLVAAESRYKAGDYAGARAEYLKVLEAHPDLTGINRAIAFSYGREGNHAEALKYLDLALSNNPDDLMLLELAAASATARSDYPRTMAYLARMDDATMSDPDVLVTAATGLVNGGRSADAITVLDRAIARFPQAPEPYFVRGFARRQAGNNAGAREDLEKFISIAPANAPQLPKAKELLAAIGPGDFRVRLDTTKGPIVVEVHRDWAPLGADRFRELVAAGYYDDSRFFRVVKGRWAQFGINGDPKVASAWRGRTIADDPPKQSNVRGTVTFAFAVPNGRTTQVYIALADLSAQQDAQGFAPFGRVVEGMDVADSLNAEYGETSGGGIRAGQQQPLFDGGNAFLDQKFPRLDRINHATIVGR